MEYLIVSLASLFAGFVDSIVGGGGLILVPALFATFPASASGHLVWHQQGGLGLGYGLCYLAIQPSGGDALVGTLARCRCGFAGIVGRCLAGDGDLAGFSAPGAAVCAAAGAALHLAEERSWGVHTDPNMPTAGSNGWASVSVC
jgi:uncharacterized membrane protein YfcA